MVSERTLRLDTPWTGTVNQDRPHDYYPRPQLVRPNWTNLNGSWNFGIAPHEQPPVFDETILVPFAAESALSGIRRVVPLGSAIHYRRTFRTPAAREERTILHFEAVDWACDVWVDGNLVGDHKGGYDAFCFDVTDALEARDEHEVTLRVDDPTDMGYQPRGKQVYDPEEIYYTATSGIWGTVWLEAVAPGGIRDLRLTPTVDGRLTVEISRWAGGNPEDVAVVTVQDGGETVSHAVGRDFVVLDVPNAKLWSPESPHLYDVVVECGADRVESYAGFREIGLTKDARGHTRLALNGEPLFQMGLLDQGYWPDGGLTAPTLEALLFDVDETKRLGFNMIRKHVKTEPRAWYAHCDRIGMLVWQDMPSGTRSIDPDEQDLDRSPESAENFRNEYEAMLRHLGNHPSIVAWVLFNEGWGQFDTIGMSEWAKALDPTRTLVAVTGWCDRGTGDVHDWHVYPGPAAPMPEEHRASTLGEFGGLGLPVPGHTWRTENWGYKNYSSKETLGLAFEELFANLRLLVGEWGLSAAVYTQTTDVETETNGLYTYDRRVLKLQPELVRACIASLHTEGPDLLPMVPISETRTPADAGGERLRRTYDVPEGGVYATYLIHHGRAAAFLDGVPRVKLHNKWKAMYNPGPQIVQHLAPGQHVLDATFDRPGGEFVLLGVVPHGTAPAPTPKGNEPRARVRRLRTASAA